MSLCFISNKDLTVPFSDIARRLRDEGEHIVWLAPSRRWANWLLVEGWPADDVLCLADHEREWLDLPLDKAMAELDGLECEPPGTLANVIQMCRNLRRADRRFSYAYLAVVRRHVEPFLQRKKVEVAFGEGTWGFELLVWLLGRKHGIPMLTPSSARVPSDRFYFADAVTANLHAVAEPTAANRDQADTFLRAWLDRPVQPTYMQLHRRGYRAFRARWLNELGVALFRPGLDRGDATLWPIGARIADRTARLMTSFACRLSPPFERAPWGERYVLYALHAQPENTIDVYGSLNSNQMAVIESLSRLLPSTHKLWVKEHKGGLTDRTLAWYRKVKALPNVRMIDPYEDIYRMIRDADLVVTVAGTTAYEAALMGVPAVALSEVFFGPLLAHEPASRSHPLEWNLGELVSKPKRLETPQSPDPRRVEFLAYLHANSYAGNPIMLEMADEVRAAPDYLAVEARGFSSFIAGLRAAGGRRRRWTYSESRGA